MFQFLKKLFGQPSTDYQELLARHAQIIDVRTPAEYAGGSIPGSLNIPLQTVKGQLSLIDKSRPVITCCASGMRSGAAKGILQAAGYEVYNGGSWASLQQKLK